MNNWHIRQSVRALKHGGVIAYPTESIFGLGCNPWDDYAVMKLLKIKQRMWGKGLILIAANFSQIKLFIQPVNPAILKLLKATWPGPVTWLLQAKQNIPTYLKGKHETIAVRVTAHPQSTNLCQAFQGALISTSANLAGFPPIKTSHNIRWILPQIDYVLPGTHSGNTTPSEIRDAQTGTKIR